MGVMTTSALERDVENLVAALQVPSSDVALAARLSEILGDTQFTRRAYIRAVFALVEGNLNLMADTVLAAAGRGEVHLFTKEMDVLRQERTTIEHGQAVSRVKFVPTRDRLGPLFDTFARLYART